MDRTQRCLEHLIANLEGALKLALLEVGDLKKTAAKRPDRLLPRLKTLEALAEEAKVLASKAYALGADLRREEEDNSAEALRALFGLEAR